MKRPIRRASPAPLVAVRLHTRREGELRWLDRGPANLPEPAVRAGEGDVLYDGVRYAIEDVFDDGHSITVWARAPEPAGGDGSASP